MAGSEVTKGLSGVRLRMFVLCLAGLSLSLYALYVEVLKEMDHSYQAMCDFNSYISCSKVFTSKYGRGFGIIGDMLGEDHVLNQPNSIPGIMFYLLVLALGEIKTAGAAKIQRAVVFTSNFMSLYLAYLLYFVLRDFCIVCVSTYIVNILLTWYAFQRVSLFKQLPKRKIK